MRRARERLVLAREEERRRLRRDLHDGVSSALTGARLLTEAVRPHTDASAVRIVDALDATLDGCAAEIRTLVDGLGPAALDGGLADALTALTVRTPDTGPRIDLHLDGPVDDLPPAVEVAAYRIVAEAVTNVVKHAGARHCRVEVARTTHHLDIDVTDDGSGLPGAPARDAAVGLDSMRSRAEELGGTCEVGTGDAGTVVRALLPLHR